MAALSNESFLLYPHGDGMRDKKLEACERAGFTPRVVLDGGELDMVLRLAEAGLGIALMPRVALDGAKHLVALRVSDQALRRTMALVSHEDRALAPAARALRSFLEDRLAPHQGH
jgi:DNA-binding transcriptional LysR family regulator